MFNLLARILYRHRAKKVSSPLNSKRESEPPLPPPLSATCYAERHYCNNFEIGIIREILENEYRNRKRLYELWATEKDVIDLYRDYRRVVDSLEAFGGMV